MKLKWVLVVLFILVVLMIHDPKNTTTELIAGEEALVGAGGAVAQGFLTKPGKKSA